MSDPITTLGEWSGEDRVTVILELVDDDGDGERYTWRGPWPMALWAAAGALCMEHAAGAPRPVIDTLIEAMTFDPPAVGGHSTEGLRHVLRDAVGSRIAQVELEWIIEDATGGGNGGGVT